MRPGPDRELKPVEEPYSAEVAEIFKSYPQRDGYILKLFRVFANSLRFLKKGTTNLLDKGSPLSMREREIVILRVCANTNCEYEWGVHVTAFGSHVGFTEAQIAATRKLDHSVACWKDKEKLLIQVIDELCQDSLVAEETYLRFQANWDLEQQLEIFALCGNYHTISFVANSARIETEVFGAMFPA